MNAALKFEAMDFEDLASAYFPRHAEPLSAKRRRAHRLYYEAQFRVFDLEQLEGESCKA